MKIRDYLNRRITPVFIGMFCCFALFGASAALAAAHPAFIVLPILAMFGFAGGIFFLMYGVRCPQCRNQLGQLTFLPKGGYFRMSRAVCFCPFCGVNLDREVDTNGQLIK